MRELRRFFEAAGYLEADTPILSPDLIPENHLDVFRTQFEQPDREARELYMVPSPEVHLKRLLAHGYGNLFQITRCFRNGESTGSRHNPEFTMLEWYTIDSDYRASLDTTFKLLQNLADRFESVAAPEAYQALTCKPRILTIETAFREYVGVSLEQALQRSNLREALTQAGLEPRSLESTEELVNLALVDRVEPNLPTDRPVALLDYPKQIPTLARELPGTPWCERWELYLGGVELANCYSEETDSEQVKRFFEAQQARKQLRHAAHAVDPGFPMLFEAGFPRCSGVALGVDRLLLVLCGADSLDEVIYFPLAAALERDESSAAKRRHS